MRGFRKWALLASVCTIASADGSGAWAEQPPGVKLLRTLPRPAPMHQRGDTGPHLGPASREQPGDHRGASALPRVPDRERTELVSVGLGGAPGNDYSFAYVLGLSHDGRYVSFDSAAYNLVPGGDVGTYDTFIRDRRTNRTEQVSVSSAGVPAEGNFFSSLSSYLSADGRFVAFDSLAGNLVPGDQPYPSGRPDVFVRDRKAKTTERVSVSSGGVPGDGSSYVVGLSADGRFVTFVSQATNLVPGYGGSFRLFLRDRRLGLTEPVCVASGGAPLANFGECFSCGMSADGRFVAFTMFDKINYDGNVFVRDRKRDVIDRVSLSSEFREYCGWNTYSLSGRYLALTAYDSSDYTTVGFFVHDLVRGTNDRVRFNAAGEEPNDYYNATQISADGRYIVLDSAATNLVQGDTNGQPDIFMVDRKTQSTRLITTGSSGEQSNGGSAWASIAPLGRVVAFSSDATNLLAEPDGNPYTDIFARTLASEE